MNEDEIVLGADTTATTNVKKSSAKANDVVSVDAVEIINAPTPAQPVVALPAGGVIIGDDVDNISFQDIKQYPAKKKDGVTPHTFAGQEYYLFSYKGKNFTTRNKDFASAHKAGDLYSVTLGERVDGSATYFELTGYTTITQRRARRNFEIEEARSDFQIKQLQSFNHEAVTANEDLLSKLLNA